MNIIIITQKTDERDSVLGFFIEWIEKFSKSLDKVFVVCLLEGVHNLPGNVEVFSLGKEKGYSKIRQFFRLQNFLFKHLKDSNGVFCHMCPIYALASFPLAFAFRKKIILWYLHKAVDWQLWLAGKLVDKILTASEESCNLKNRRKIEIVGHGIQVQNSKLKAQSWEEDSGLKLLYVGRISTIKDLETLIEAVDILEKDKKFPVNLKIVGDSIDKKEKAYEVKIRQIISQKGLESIIQFIGPVLHKDIGKYYLESDILVNLSPTGGLDKAVLEAMAFGILPLVANFSFKNSFGKYADNLIFQEKNPNDLALKITDLAILPKVKKQEIAEDLFESVKYSHNLDNLILKIISRFSYVRK